MKRRVLLAAAAVALASGHVAETRGQATEGAPTKSEAVARHEAGDPGLTAQRVSLAFDSAQVRDVLAALAEFTGLSFAPNADAAAVTIRAVDIRSRPWPDALEAILTAQGLGWETNQAGIIVVDWLESLDDRQRYRREATVFELKHAEAVAVVNSLQHLLTPGLGEVVADPAANALVVTDSPSALDRIAGVVAQLDRPRPQIAIEAKIIYVNRSGLEALGITYDLKDRQGAAVEQGINHIIPAPDPASRQDVDTDGDGEPDAAIFDLTNETIVSFGGSAIAAVADARAGVAAPVLQILVAAALGDFTLFGFLEALETARLTEVRAAPSIRALDNTEARIQVGERTPIRVLESGAQLEQARVSVRFEDTGIILNVLPRVLGDGNIRLQLAAERSGVISTGAEGYTFQRQVGETTLVVEDGETAVIGGLTLAERVVIERGVPGLMRLPLIGGLFRSRSVNEVKMDLMILVTPRILTPRGG